VPLVAGLPNLGTEADRIIEPAGVELWEKTFVNLWGSCSDELEREYPAHVVDAWMGNSSRTRRRHCLKATTPTSIGPPVTRHRQQPSTLHQSREKSLNVVKDAENQYPRQGTNRVPPTRGKPYAPAIATQKATQLDRSAMPCPVTPTSTRSSPLGRACCQRSERPFLPLSVLVGGNDVCLRLQHLRCRWWPRSLLHSPAPASLQHHQRRGAAPAGWRGRPAADRPLD